MEPPERHRGSAADHPGLIMAKLNTLNIPPEMATLWDQYLTIKDISNPGRVLTSSSKQCRKAAPKKNPKAYNRRLLELCRRMAYAYAAASRKPFDKAWMLARYNEALTGIFPSPYWRELPLISATYYTSTPTSSPDLNPGPYAYRDPLNQPTAPIYPAGTETPGPASYTGETFAGYFEDSQLTWRHQLHEIADANDAADPTYLILKTNMQFNVAASNRPSRPMFSMLVSATTGTEADPAMPVTTPPIAAATSIYSRYRPPYTAPPYYAATKPAEHTIVMQTKKTATPTSDPAELMLQIAPRPMFGKGFNNNVQVETSHTFNTTPRVIIPNFRLSAVPWQMYGTNPLRYFNPLTGQTISRASAYAPDFFTYSNGQTFGKHVGATVYIYSQRGRLVKTITRSHPVHTYIQALIAHPNGWMVVEAKNTSIPSGYADVEAKIYSDAGHLQQTLILPVTAPTIAVNFLFQALLNNTRIYQDDDVRIAYRTTTAYKTRTLIAKPANYFATVLCRAGVFVAGTDLKLWRLNETNDTWQHIADLTNIIGTIAPTRDGIIYKKSDNKCTAIDATGNRTDYPTAVAFSLNNRYHTRGQIF